MNNYEKLELAKKLLREISDNWNEDEVEQYACSMSFDEFVMELHGIRLKPRWERREK